MVGMEEHETQKEKAPELEASPETDTETLALYIDDLPGWEKYPRLLVDALHTGEIDFYDFGIVSYIVIARHWKLGVWRGTMRKLMEEIGWPFSTTDGIRKRLVDLRENKWIDYESVPGKRSAYVIRLGQRLLDGQRNVAAPTTHLRPTSDETPPSASEVTSDGISSPNGASLDVNSDSTSTHLRRKPLCKT